MNAGEIVQSTRVGGSSASAQSGEDDVTPRAEMTNASPFSMPTSTRSPLPAAGSALYVIEAAVRSTTPASAVAGRHRAARTPIPAAAIRSARMVRPTLFPPRPPLQEIVPRSRRTVEVVSAASSNPRAPRRRTSAELTRDVREGRRFAEALRTLDFRAPSADDADHALADEIARALVRRAGTRHEGWRNLRQALRQAGAEPPWARCERQAQRLTSERVMLDCAEPGRTSMVRVQHAAAQELARTLATHTDPGDLLARLLDDTAPEHVTEEAWERALVAAVRARSQSGVGALIADSLAPTSNAA